MCVCFCVCIVCLSAQIQFSRNKNLTKKVLTKTVGTCIRNALTLRNIY